LDEDRWAGLYFVEDGCQSIPWLFHYYLSLKDDIHS
jgi:hypothetical protein